LEFNCYKNTKVLSIIVSVTSRRHGATKILDSINSTANDTTHQQVTVTEQSENNTQNTTVNNMFLPFKVHSGQYEPQY